MYVFPQITLIYRRNRSPSNFQNLIMIQMNILLLRSLLVISAITAMNQPIVYLPETMNVINPSLKPRFMHILRPLVLKLHVYNDKIAILRIRGFLSIDNEPITLFLIKQKSNQYACVFTHENAVHNLYPLIESAEFRFDYDANTDVFSPWNVAFANDESDEIMEEMKLEVRHCDDDETVHTVVISSKATVEDLKKYLGQESEKLRCFEFVIGYRGAKLSNDQILADFITTDRDDTPILEICNPVIIKPRQRVIATGH